MCIRDRRALDHRYGVEELLYMLGRGETHHPLDPRPVIPATIEDDDLARRRQVVDVALDVHLALLALGRCGQCDDTENTRAHPLGYGPVSYTHLDVYKRQVWQ